MDTADTNRGLIEDRINLWITAISHIDSSDSKECEFSLEQLKDILHQGEAYSLGVVEFFLPTLSGLTIRVLSSHLREFISIIDCMRDFLLNSSPVNRRRLEIAVQFLSEKE